MKASGLSIDDILADCSEGIFKIPAFQRDFVWTPSQISGFAESALQGLPCGGIVTWENTNNFKDAKVIRILEKTGGKRNYKEFPPQGKSYRKVSQGHRHVVDGMQRLTAICIAFGGLKNSNSTYKYGGKFFLDLNAPEINGSVIFKKDNIIKNEDLDSIEGQMNRGLVELSSNDFPLQRILGGTFVSHWSKISNNIPPNNKKWQLRALEISQNISTHIIAEMAIPRTYNLAAVADNFEKLNTRGTTVSMIDVMHSVLYEWFKTNKKIDFKLRDWVDQIYDSNSTSGWGREGNRQIIAQLVVGTELIAKKRKQPRKGGDRPISIRNQDILSLNESHWHEIDRNLSSFKEAIKNFQTCVIGSQFPEKDCPYSKSSVIYVGLYYKQLQETVVWTKDRLNEIFRAFFWANALSQNYETDSLRVGYDMRDIEELLRKNHKKSDSEWRSIVNNWIQKDIFINSVTQKDLEQDLLGSVSGARRQTLMLPIKYNAKKDIVDPNVSIDFPANENIELHHIFPRVWIRDNSNSNIFPKWYADKELLEERRECIANLTPLAANSNLTWKAKSPSTMISGFKNRAQFVGKPIWTNRFIDNQTYNALSNDQPEAFLEFRAEQIALWILDQIKI